MGLAFLWELGCWLMELLSFLSRLYQPQALPRQPFQDVVACVAVPPSQVSDHCGGFLGEESQLQGGAFCRPEPLGKLFAPQSVFYSRC